MQQNELHFFHGTTSNVRASILKNGLQPMPQYRWQIAIPEWFSDKHYRPYQVDETDTVSLTPELWYANQFAQWRTNYLKAQPGKYFSPDTGKPSGFMDWFKESFAPHIQNVTPIVFKVTLTQSQMELLEKDTRKNDAEAFLYRGTIPPESLTLLTKPRQATQSRADQSNSQSTTYNSIHPQSHLELSL